MRIRYKIDESIILLPLVGNIACGSPMLAEENVEDLVPVRKSWIRPGHKYFLLRAKGDSMDECGIYDGDIVLVRQVCVPKDGEKVVAILDDCATIKKYSKHGNGVHLMPQSSNPTHQKIIVTHSILVQGVVEANLSKDKLI